MLTLAPVWRLSLFLCTDAVFCATSHCFLIAAETFGMQRLQGAPAVPYPGTRRSYVPVPPASLQRMRMRKLMMGQVAPSRPVEGGFWAAAHA